jgi:hypothetical protein
MTVISRRFRRGVLVPLGFVALALAGCGSSAPSGGGSPAASSTSAASSTATSAPAASSTAAAAGGGDVKKACADYVELKRINDEFDKLGSDLSSGNRLMSTLVTTATGFADAAPSVVTKPAKDYLGAVTTLKSYVAKAKSTEQLHQQSASDPVLKNALVTLGASAKQIETWSKTVCA